LRFQESDEKKVCCRNGVVVKSRQISHRDVVQKKLDRAMSDINRQFKKYVAVKFDFTIGDEFQGLLYSPEKSYAIVREFQKILYPLKILFGIGDGFIKTSIARRTARMDGDCFVKSRDALENAKKLNQSVVYNARSGKLNSAVNTIVMLMDVIKSRWGKIHFRRIFAYEELGTFGKVARKEKVSRQMISKMFSDIKYGEIKKAEENLGKLLSTL